MTYEQFLETKRKEHIHSGFEANINSSFLFPFQNFIVNKSLSAGKYGVFSGTGTGKSRMQLRWAQAVVDHTNAPVLIMAPLAVSSQTITEGKNIHIPVEKLTGPPKMGIYIINYDQLDNIVDWIPEFSGIALDEGSILKNHEGAYRNQIIDLFKRTPYKSVWSATPSPNSPMEIGNYSEFLDVMPRSEMLAMYFVHDGGETNKWRLKGHSNRVFWEWVSTWAIMFQKPSDIGFEQSGYDLPPLNFIELQIETDKKDNGMLFNDSAVSATSFNQELRRTKDKRLSKVADIVNGSDETFLIWIKQNEEGDELKRLIPDAVEVRGSDTVEWKEEKLSDFALGRIRVLVTKSKIAGAGMNFQNCHNQIFAAPDFSFEAVFQSIRRSWRFGQKDQVNIYLVTTDTMQNVGRILREKERQFEQMQEEMTKAVNRKLKSKEKMERQFQEEVGNNFKIQLGDCVQLIKNIPDESIGLSIFSPPFSELYVYSDELEDMGNSKDYKEFFVAFNFLAKELHRVMWSGRNVVVHCMDLPIQKGKEGYIGLRDFSNMIRQSFEDAGFIYHSRVTIWKNPVTEMQRTKALGLLHKQVKKDAAMSRVGIPDYLLVFRKPGEHEHPVKCEISVDTWQQYASPVWMDIDYGDTLNGREGRGEADEKHIAPLQLQTIERTITLWSNKGDTILTPFMGIGSEVFQAIKMGRNGIGFELKKSYFDLAIRNCRAAEQGNRQQLLFK